MIVLVPSIFHTGSHVLWGMFKDWERIGTHLEDMRLSDDTDYWVQFHLTDNQSHSFDLTRRYKMVIPMRHPVRVWESFNRKGLKMSFFEEQWRNLERVMEHGPRFIHVDSRDRDEHVKRVSEWLERPLHNDWPLMTTSNTHNLLVTPERTRALPGWIMEVYNETKESSP